MNTRLLAWGAAAAALLVLGQVGCTPRRSDDLRVDLRPDCPVARGSAESSASLAPLALALGEAAAKPLVMAAAKAARTAAQGHATSPLVGTWPDYFYVSDGNGHLLPNRRLGCLVVQTMDLRAASRAASATDTPDAGAQARIYFEAAIVLSSDGESFELQPRTLSFREPGENSALGSAARDLSFRVQFTQAGSAQPYVETMLYFHNLVPAPDMRLGLEKLAQPVPRRTGWLPTPSADDAMRRVLAAESQRKAKGPGAGATSGVPERSKLGKTTVTVSVVETREGSLIWQLIADTLDSLLPTLDSAPSAAGPAAK